MSTYIVSGAPDYIHQEHMRALSTCTHVLLYTCSTNCRNSMVLVLH